MGRRADQQSASTESAYQASLVRLIVGEPWADGSLTEAAARHYDCVQYARCSSGVTSLVNPDADDAHDIRAHRT